MNPSSIDRREQEAKAPRVGDSLTISNHLFAYNQVRTDGTSVVSTFPLIFKSSWHSLSAAQRVQIRITQQACWEIEGARFPEAVERELGDQGEIAELRRDLCGSQATGS